MNIDSEDFELTADQLRRKYDTEEGWGNHPVYSMRAWQFNVAECNTRLGYWEWVERVLETVRGIEEDTERRIREDEP